MADPTKFAQFDGVDDYIALPVAANLDLNENFTLFCYIRVGAFLGNTAIFRRGINGPWAGNIQYNLTVAPADRIVFTMVDGNYAYPQVFAPGLPTDTWMLVAARCKSIASGGAMDIWINGSLASNVAHHLSVGPVAAANSQTLGLRYSADLKLDGDLAVAAIYSPVLSDSDVADLTAGVPISPSPVSRWLDTGGSGATVPDSVGTNHGAAMGSDPDLFWQGYSKPHIYASVINSTALGV